MVGAGVVGLAMALAAGRRGRRVTVFEREATAIGASVRNFGLVLPLSQPPGPLHDRALRSREIWLELAQAAGLHHSAEGLLVLARHADELRVLEEYLEQTDGSQHGRRLLTPFEATRLSAAARPEGLLAALYSPTEMVIDPREAIRSLPRHLHDRHGVEVRHSTLVREANAGRLETTAGSWTAEEVIICSGADFQTLYPEQFARSGLQRVKLQMLRTVSQPAGWKLGPALCAGLSLTHYPAFRGCPGLAELRARLERELPFHVANGIHLLATQTGAGQITIGDSHHYGHTVDPFDSEAVNTAMLDYFAAFARLPRPEIQERWHGVYAKHPEQVDVLLEPEPGVTVVGGLGGAGMTFAFGLAEELARARGW